MLAAPCPDRDHKAAFNEVLPRGRSDAVWLCRLSERLEPSTKSSPEGGVMLSRHRALMKQRILEAFREPRARSRPESPKAAFLAV